MTALARSFDPSGDIFQEDFARNARNLPGESLDWLNARRRSAMIAFATTGIPNRRVEAWKYTDLANALDGSAEPALPPQQPVNADAIFPPQQVELLFADGFLINSAGDERVEVFDLAHLDAQTPGWIRDHLGMLAAASEQPAAKAASRLFAGAWNAMLWDGRK